METVELIVNVAPAEIVVFVLIVKAPLIIAFAPEGRLLLTKGLNGDQLVPFHV
jgi:hypothetical protein